MDKPWLKFYEPDVPENIDIPDKPLFEVLTDAAKDFPDNTACIFLGNEKTYKQVSEEVDRLANALEKLGIKQGDVIGLMLGNMPQFLTAFFGSLKAGAGKMQIVTGIGSPMAVVIEALAVLFVVAIGFGERGGFARPLQKRLSGKEA